MARRKTGGDFMQIIHSDFGDKAGNFLSGRRPIEAISTGSLAIDHIIGPYCGGVPLGKLSQIFGGEGSGKSLLCCQIISEAQKMGLPTFLVDRENHYTPEWFGRFGGDAELVYDLHPNTVEECFSMVEAAVNWILKSENSYGGLFVIDSLQSLPTARQFETDSGSGVALASVANYLSGQLGKTVERIRESGLSLICVGQLRNDPSPFALASHREYTPGGNALRHASVLRLFMRYKGRIIEKDDDTGYENGIGFTASVETAKNNVGGMAPWKYIELDFYDTTGSDDTRSLFQIAKSLGIIERSGSWYNAPSVGDKFQGEANWKVFLEGFPALREEISVAVLDPQRVLANEMTRMTGGDENVGPSDSGESPPGED